jgi:hypothetical protein
MKTVSRTSPKSSRPARSRLGLLLRVCWTLAALAAPFLLLAAEAWADTPTVAENLGSLLRGYAEELYGGLVGVSSLIFLWNRRYVELGTFLIAAIVVAWLVFAPATIAKAAEGIAHQIFG